MTTDLAEAGLERLICEALTGDPCEPASGGTVGEPSPGYGGGGWSPGNRHDYDREYCVDLCQLRIELKLNAKSKNARWKNILRFGPYTWCRCARDSSWNLSDVMDTDLQIPYLPGTGYPSFVNYPLEMLRIVHSDPSAS